MFAFISAWLSCTPFQVYRRLHDIQENPFRFVPFLVKSLQIHIRAFHILGRFAITSCSISMIVWHVGLPISHLAFTSFTDIPNCIFCRTSYMKVECISGKSPFSLKLPLSGNELSFAKNDFDNTCFVLSIECLFSDPRDVHRHNLNKIRYNTRALRTTRRLVAEELTGPYKNIWHTGATISSNRSVLLNFHNLVRPQFVHLSKKIQTHQFM